MKTSSNWIKKGFVLAFCRQHVEHLPACDNFSLHNYVFIAKGVRFETLKSDSYQFF